MSVPNRQIGWSNESNLLWNISKQLERLTGVTFTSLSALAPTYKVYTALLTQSGVDDPISIDTGTLTIGVTYFIDEVFDNSGADFINVGAPNNNVGTYFVATGTIPNSWGEVGSETTLIYNTGAPVATVLENTIGNIYWTYNNSGEYDANLVGAFIEVKTFILNPLSGYDSNVLQGGGGGPYNIYRFSDDKCIILTADDSLNNSPIEIRVYN